VSPTGCKPDAPGSNGLCYCCCGLRFTRVDFAHDSVLGAGPCKQSMQSEAMLAKRAAKRLIRRGPCAFAIRRAQKSRRQLCSRRRVTAQTKGRPRMSGAGLGSCQAGGFQRITFFAGSLPGAGATLP
jgi:hypothetical protein